MTAIKFSTKVASNIFFCSLRIELIGGLILIQLSWKAHAHENVIGSSKSAIGLLVVVTGQSGGVEET